MDDHKITCSVLSKASVNGEFYFQVDRSVCTYVGLYSFVCLQWVTFQACLSSQAVLDFGHSSYENLINVVLKYFADKFRQTQWSQKSTFWFKDDEVCACLTSASLNVPFQWNEILFNSLAITINTMHLTRIITEKNRNTQRNACKQEVPRKFESHLRVLILSINLKD